MANYKQDSPSSEMLNMGPPSAFGGGSQAGSDYGFGTPQSISIDTMLQGGQMNDGTGNGIAAQLPNYRSGPTSVPGYGVGYDSLVGGNHVTSLSSYSNVRSGSSPVVPHHHHHRLSISSNGPYASLERQTSQGGSDTTSQGGHTGHGEIGENPLAGNSNDTVDSLGQGGVDPTNGGGADAQNDATPVWSELKTKAGKERKRLPLACIACRRKKIRCSGEKPACKHCLRSRIPCVYKVTTRKAAPRTDYMAMLDKRLKRMEDRVIKIIPKEEQGIVASTGRAVVKPPLPAAPPKSATGTKKRAAGQAFGDDLDEWANIKAATDEQRKDDSQTGVDPETQKAHDSEEHNLLLEGADKLPPREIQEHLSEVFFDYVYGQSYHLLHKPSFMRKLAQGTVPPVLMLAVCAISARFSNHPTQRTEPAFLRGESWATAAREIALKRYDTPNITILIVYLILGLHEFGTCQGGRSWMFGGMAQRMAYALQLHKDLDHDPKLRRGSNGKNGEGELTFTDREIRRRTMWSCFIMDRFNSSGTDRPTFVSEQYIRAQLPIKETYYQMEITGPTEDLEGSVPNPVEPDTGQMSNARDNMGVAAYLIRLVAIWGRVIQYLNLGGKSRDKYPMWDEDSLFQAIRRDTEEWKEALPADLHYTPDNLQNAASEKVANQFIFLHIVYNQITLVMVRFALPTPGTRSVLPEGMPTDFIATSSHAAFEAANQISALAHEAMDHNLVAPFAGYAAFFSSTVHIHGAFSKNTTLEASSKQNLAWNVKFLTKMKKYWGMFHFVTENLRDLYRRHADAARSGAIAAEKGDATSKEGAIFQYGDWFDRYPHGVSGTDYEEPSVEIKREPGSDAVLGQKSDLQTVEEFFSKLSPPSRTAHVQQQQKKQSKKRRASKSVSKQNDVTLAASQQPLQAQHQPFQSQHIQVPHDLHASPQHNFAPGDVSGIGQQHPQHSLAFPPGWQTSPNPLLAHNNLLQQPMSQLDRQMVLNSYAGIDPGTAHATQNFQHNLGHGMMTQQQHHSQTVNDLDPFNLDAFAAAEGHNAAVNGQTGPSMEYWGSESTAWFMPFNMAPPNPGDETGFFNTNHFDAYGFNAYGDMSGSGMAPTGLTPRLDTDLDTGQDTTGGGDTGGLEGLQ